MAQAQVLAQTTDAKPSVSRDIQILVIDNEEALLSAMWHALDSEGWQIRAAADAAQVLPVLASSEWTAVLANVAIVGLDGPVFETLKELALSPAVEDGHHRARVLFLVPESMALEARPVLEGWRLPYTFKPINLHDLLEKVSDLMLEAQAIAAPIRRVRDQRGRGKRSQQSKVFNQRQSAMIAPREDYTFTEEELAEFERSEAAARTSSPGKKKNPKDLGAPAK